MDGCHVSLFEFQASIFNGHESVNIVVKVMTGCADVEHLTLLNVASGHF
jgi:hypothetical protein